MLLGKTKFREASSLPSISLIEITGIFLGNGADFEFKVKGLRQIQLFYLQQSATLHT